MKAYYNDIDPYCCKVLRKEIAAGNLPDGDVDERDIRDVRASELAGYGQIHLFAGIGGIPLGFRWAGVRDDFSICTGGFPCQDISNAGKRAGIDGAQSGLWAEFARIIRECGPHYVLIENVPALRSRGLSRVLADLAALGFDAEWFDLSACALGAPHTRERVFVLAYAQGIGRPLRPSSPERSWRPASGSLAAYRAAWAAEPAILRVVDGVPHRLERLRGVGNAVCVPVAAYIGRQIVAFDEATR